MSWAKDYITKLKEGQTVKFRPRGKSMTGLINDGQLVTVVPLKETDRLEIGTIVLCQIKSVYLHKVLDRSIQNNVSMYQIGNNKGFINGWTPRSKIYGICTKVED